MSNSYAWAEVHELSVGDRVRIRPDRWPLPGQLKRGATVVGIIGMPRDSYLVRVDGDTQHSRVWFFYRSEIEAGSHTVRNL